MGRNVRQKRVKEAPVPTWQVLKPLDLGPLGIVLDHGDFSQVFENDLLDFLRVKGN